MPAQMKNYLVQTWDTEGALKNHYSVAIDGDRELADLRKFLKQKFSHVLVTREPNTKPKPKVRGR